MLLKAFYVLVLIPLSNVGTAEQLNSTKNGTFVATNEWQEIREGQGIPAGLHVRINLQTGKKEAKLLDPNSEHQEGAEGTAALSTLPENASDTPAKVTRKQKLKLSKTLADALRKWPQERPALEHTPQQWQDIQRKYKTYKELKDTYKEMEKNFKTDAELVVQLLEEYAELESTTAQGKQKTQLKLLEDFNTLVHQIDNALVFVNKGGLDKVLLPLVNQTQLELRIPAMRILGALAQNNPAAQVKVFEHGFGSQLSQVLISSTNTDELSTALYALGSLLRKFPYAQQRILSTYGTQALVAVLAKKCELKIKAKVVTLISDILVEKALALNSATSANDPLAAAQYSEISFPEWLRAHAYCDALDTLVSSNLYALLEQPNEMEYFAEAMDTTDPICAYLWAESPQLRHALLTLKNRYLASGDEYRMEVGYKIGHLAAQLYEVELRHEEL